MMFPSPQRARQWIRSTEHRFHDAALHMLGLERADRERVVESMITRRRRDSVAYWTLILLSMGIATLGLAKGSEAVVIGGMLIAPLLGPLQELGMALVLGSPALTMRSLVRTVGSIITVIAAAAVLTLLLPYHEVTATVLDRTFPTVLDLLIAIFVALAAAFTTVRSSSDTASAAAGAAIGISLVPPLCATGFGIGIGNPEIAGGAMLLFITNLTAILFVSALSFWILGFEMVDASAWEEAVLASVEADSIAQRTLHFLHRVFGSRHGRVIRAGIPAILVAISYIPLSLALDRVAWEVTARNSVSRILDQALRTKSAVRSAVNVQHGSIALDLFLVDSPEQARGLQSALSQQIAAATGIVPTVRVVAVPDLDAVRKTTPGTPTKAIPPAAHLADIRQQITSNVEAIWPAELGVLSDWRLEVTDAEHPQVVLQHWGEPGGPAVDALLARTLSDRISAVVAVRTHARSRATIEAPWKEGVEWLPGFIRSVDDAQRSQLHVCIEIPRARLLRTDPSLRNVAAVVRTEAARLPENRVGVTDDATRWSAHLSQQPCGLTHSAP